MPKAGDTYFVTHVETSDLVQYYPFREPAPLISPLSAPVE